MEIAWYVESCFACWAPGRSCSCTCRVVIVAVPAIGLRSSHRTTTHPPPQPRTYMDPLQSLASCSFLMCSTAWPKPQWQLVHGCNSGCSFVRLLPTTSVMLFVPLSNQLTNPPTIPSTSFRVLRWFVCVSITIKR